MNKNLPLFVIIYEDGSKYQGGYDYLDTKWLGAPINKKIKRVFYKLPMGDYICLEGYESYFHMIEATKDVMRVSGKSIKQMNAEPRIECAYIMGKKGNKVASYRITLQGMKDGRYKPGDMTLREFSIESKFIQKLNKMNWR